MQIVSHGSFSFGIGEVSKKYHLRSNLWTLLMSRFVHSVCKSYHFSIIWISNDWICSVLTLLWKDFIANSKKSFKNHVKTEQIQLFGIKIILKWYYLHTECTNLLITNFHRFDIKWYLLDIIIKPWS